jgi:hypothetical protein
MIVWVLIVAVGLVLCVRAVTSAQRAGDASSWPAVKGKIIEASVTRHERMSDPNRSHTTRDYAYSPRIIYRYEVQGAEYTSGRLAHSDSQYGTKTDVEALVAGYRVGGEVDVYYDPQDPSFGVLDPTDPGGAPAALVFMGIFTVMIGIMGIVGSLH